MKKILVSLIFILISTIASAGDLKITTNPITLYLGLINLIVDSNSDVSIGTFNSNAIGVEYVFENGLGFGGEWTDININSSFLGLVDFTVNAEIWRWSVRYYFGENASQWYIGANQISTVTTLDDASELTAEVMTGEIGYSSKGELVVFDFGFEKPFGEVESGAEISVSPSIIMRLGVHF